MKCYKNDFEMKFEEITQCSLLSISFGRSPIYGHIVTWSYGYATHIETFKEIVVISSYNRI